MANIISSEEVDGLDPHVRTRFTDGLRRARKAENIFDLGVARGLILALLEDGLIDKHELARMYGKLCSEAQEVIEAAPAEFVGSYGRGLKVILSPGSRR